MALCSVCGRGGCLCAKTSGYLFPNKNLEGRVGLPTAVGDEAQVAELWGNIFGLRRAVALKRAQQQPDVAFFSVCQAEHPGSLAPSDPSRPRYSGPGSAHADGTDWTLESLWVGFNPQFNSLSRKKKSLQFPQANSQWRKGRRLSSLGLARSALLPRCMPRTEAMMLRFMSCAVVSLLTLLAGL